MPQVTYAFCNSVAQCNATPVGQRGSVAVDWARVFVILASGALCFGGSWSFANANPPVLNGAENPSTASSSWHERSDESAKPSAGPLRSKQVLFATKQDTLIGLEGVRVIVEGLDDDAIGTGLSHNSLQTVVELQLRKHRVPVLELHQFQANPMRPIIYVNVGLIQAADERITVYVVDISLHQRVSLIHGNQDVDIHAYAITWRVPSTYGIVDTNFAKKRITEILEEKIDTFSNDYLKANSP